MSFFSQCIGDAVNTDGASQGVHVRQLMSHNDDLFRRLYGFPEGMRFDSRLDPGIFFLLDAFAAIIENVVLCLYHNLIPASGKSQVNGAAGVFLALLVGVCLNADSHAYSDGYVIPHIYVPDLI